MRLLLACILILFSETAAFAENDSRTFVEGCRDSSSEGRIKIAECIAVIGTLMAVGPYLRDDLRFCPDGRFAIYGMGVMNKYVKAHPDVLRRDAPKMDSLSMLTLAFRDYWPCKDAR